MSETRKNGGFLFVELIVSLSIIGLILACLGTSLIGFGRFNHYQLTRQHCTAAAHAQLDSMAVSGKQIDENDFNRLWPKVDVSIEVQDGTDQWQGLKLIKVKSKANSFNRVVKVELSRYLPAEGGL
ncbi:type II secretion system protein [Planctomycetota bacterium]